MASCKQDDFKRRGWSDVAIVTQPPEISGVLRFTPEIWIAAFLEMSAVEAFKAIGKGGGIREGVVLKNPDALLEPCYKETANSKWGVKTRYATKNYSH
jgi:hypothetical protein